MLQAHGLSHAGAVRSTNQDRILVSPELGCFAVWDGMGGQRSGDVAAEVGCTVFENYIASSEHPAEVTWPFGYNTCYSLNSNRLLTSIRLANRQIAARADRDLAYAGMGTTVACVLVRDYGMSMANVGDSRVYWLRNSVLEKISVDDTMAALMVSKGVIAPGDVPSHPMKSILMQAVGSHAELDVHLREESLETGDVVLLCSDGVYSVLDETAICEVLARRVTVAERASELIERSLAAGVSDNVSAIIVSWE